MMKTIRKFYNKVKLKKEMSELTDESEEIPIAHIKVFHKEYPRLPSIMLPSVEKEKSELETLLDCRESHRIFSDIPLTLKELSKILGSCRIVDDNREPERRTYPSGGARFPVEIYFIAYNVDGLNEGAYHYNIRKNSMEQLIQKDLTILKRDLISPYLENPAGTIFFTSVIPRSEIKYGPRAYPYSLIEAGHMGQNIQLSATEIGIGACSVSGFVDDTIINLLDLIESEIPIYSISIGKKK